jgi:hypothetical protein
MSPRRLYIAQNRPVLRYRVTLMDAPKSPYFPTGIIMHPKLCVKFVIWGIPGGTSVHCGSGDTYLVPTECVPSGI